METSTTKEMVADLYKAIVAVNDLELCEGFCRDLLTATETEQLAKRLRAAKLLSEGKTYSQIIEQTEISGATLSRVNNCIKHGSGAYKRIIETLNA